MKAYKDGWHTIAGYRVYMEAGKILRGITDDGQRTFYVYRWHRGLDGWTSAGGVTPAAFRAGIRRGTITTR